MRGPGQPRKPSHFIPRTPAGRASLAAFAVLFGLTQPPVVHTLANRITPWILGMPFLYAWLLGAYLALIAVLLWAHRKGV